ncbi:hypothetical protein [Flavivirga aquatica]|nr:hypothetical protein [Flavivirga aquatica]
MAVKNINHKIVLKHPGEDIPVEVTLVEVQDSDGLPIAYFTDVESVICLEQVCKIVSVRIYWNNIGVYQKYELENGATLEKYEDDLFDPEDYKKLHTILANIDSPYKEVYLDEILTVVDEHTEDIDAVSGATALELDEKDTVPGAALTCFTLWHWVNGDIVSIIKNKTGESVSNKQLQQFLVDENETYFYIAIAELQKRKNYSKEFIDTIIKRGLKDDFLLRTAFNYLKGASVENYLYAAETLFFKGSREQKLTTTRSLINTDYKVSKGYLNNFSTQFSKLDYQEVSLLLELMQDKNPNSKVVIENVLPLLSGDFIIARRAYWFLNNETLTTKQEREIKCFYKKHKDKL